MRRTSLFTDGGGIVPPSAAPRGIFVKNSTKKYWTFPSRGFAEINQGPLQPLLGP